MDDPHSVEADNDFSTRRMTRSALKRALGPLESDPEQKKLISDQNLGRKEGRDRRGEVVNRSEEAENYSKKLGESERFDVMVLPSFIKEYGLIRPVKQSINEQLVIEKCSKSAIAIYNKEHKTKCRFVEVIRANFKLGSGIFYYITFVAEDNDVSSARNFQAFVRYQFEKITVQFCGLEKPPNGRIRGGGKSSGVIHFVGY
ncbi:hypothetical protein Vadar_012869 [Vaccinium darrowii]|uniref:Uncharacterized protein n=1 Tax=Vaccinium darrowii TaxID=229202 RepID=A0ACB7YV19_9ERIC|nr:hypothetical protein Vadar_012869 [Vaccinium darrowii]